MELYEAIRGRRSVRQFQDRPVEQERLERILDAALWAPSAHNAQAWRFTVARGETKRAIERAMVEAAEGAEARGESLPGFKATARLVGAAPVLIAAFHFRSEPILLRETYALRELLLLSAQIQSVAAAIENLLLAAHAEGLGAVWIGYTNLIAARLKEILGEDGFPVAAVALGYPRQAPPAPERKPRPERVVLRGA
ncbi:MAG: nitroreductase family protein [Candidatus Bipolaricaulota bacterium]|jgi:nitroreductase|nr:nitroreductase family protein [Candidatus Bipolaricaulota bacterium]